MPQRKPPLTTMDLTFEKLMPSIDPAVSVENLCQKRVCRCGHGALRLIASVNAVIGTPRELR